MGELLRVEHVSKRFGITQALDDVSVSFDAGEVHALMGENGAGKSTLGKIIAGLHRQDAGTVTIGGRGLKPGSIDEAFAAGVRIVHQELAQCPQLTVAENLCLHDLPRTRLGLVDRRAMNERAARIVARIEPSIDVRAALGSLSPGHRQIVQIAAALDEGESRAPLRRSKTRGASPAGGGGGGHAARVIVFDEPTSSLSIAETERLLKIVRQLAAEGLTIIYVSHRMGEIFACCDRVTVLRDGKHVATTPIKQLDEPALVEQMIGRRLAEAEKKAWAGHAAKEGRAALLTVRGMTSPGRIENVSVEVHAGEVVGIGGLVGAGRSELMDAVFGLDPRARGVVMVEGKPVRPHSPRASIRAGVGYVPEDRRLQGLFFQLGVDENIVLPVMPRLSKWGVRGFGAEKRLVGDRLRALQVKAASARALPGSLSGGNQQKLLIARWMSEESRVLLLDEPTRGIDVGTKAEIYKLVRAAAERGVAVLLVSSEMPELLALSDRVIVLSEGRMTGELKGAEMTQANILRLATKTSAAPSAA